MHIKDIVIILCLILIISFILSSVTITVNAAEITTRVDEAQLSLPAVDMGNTSFVATWHRDVSKLRPWNFLAYFEDYMVKRGVPIDTIYLILILPVIATIVAFSRQVIGFKALGIYTPSIVAIFFLATGLKYGLAIFLVTLLVGTLGRLLGSRIRLAYLPKMAIVLTLVGLGIFALFFIGTYFGRTRLVEISIFPILIMVLLTEKFIDVQIEQGSKRTIRLILETMVLSILCYLLANWQTLRNLIVNYPEYILLTIIINLLIGKWTGLRLFELYRFRKVIKNVELAEKN